MIMSALLRLAIDATLDIDKVRTGDIGGSASAALSAKALAARTGQG